VTVRSIKLHGKTICSAEGETWDYVEDWALRWPGKHAERHRKRREVRVSSLRRIDA